MNFVSTLQKTSFPSSGQQYSSKGKVLGRKQNDDSEQGGYNRQQERQWQRNSPWYAGHAYNISCKWEPFRDQVLKQWDRLTAHEVEAVGPNRSLLAILIEKKYGIASHLVENYLRNFERTLPLI